jgi:dihydrofolate reductase
MWRGDGVRAVPQLEEAFLQAYALSPSAIFVAGGGEIYRAAWPRLTHLEITEVDQEPVGDVTFPDIDPAEWRETARDARQGFSFVSYQRH